VIITRQNENEYLQDKPAEYKQGWEDAVKGETVNVHETFDDEYVNGYSDSMWNSESDNPLRLN